jgi:hypothetical protein
MLVRDGERVCSLTHTFEFCCVVIVVINDAMLAAMAGASQDRGWK